jgi:hypothetical protein
MANLTFDPFLSIPESIRDLRLAELPKTGRLTRLEGEQAPLSPQKQLKSMEKT